MANTDLPQILISKNQTLGDFERDELSKHNITLAEFKLTPAFQEETYIPKDMRDKGYTSAIAAHTTFEMFEKEGTAPDPKPKEGLEPEKLEVPTPTIKDVAPEAAALKTLLDAVDTSLPNISAEVDEVTDKHTSVDITATRVLPSVRNSFTSNLKMLQSKYNHSIMWYERSASTIDASNPRAYELGMYKAVVDLMRDSNYMVGKLPSELEQMWGKAVITPYSASGVDIASIVSSLQHVDRVRSARRYPKILSNSTKTVPANLRRYFVDSTMNMLPHELDYVRGVDALTVSRLAPARTLHDIMRPFSDMEHSIAPLENYDPITDKFYRPLPNLGLLDSWMDDPSNFRMRNAMFDAIFDIVSKYMTANITATDSVLSDFISVMGSNNTRASKTQNYPYTLESRSGIDTIKKLVAVKLAPRYGAIAFDLPLYDSAIGHLVTCFTVKLICRETDLHPDTVMDVENYLAAYFVPSCAGYNRANDPFDMHEAEYRTTNFLKAQFAQGNVMTGPLAGDIWQFINGWADQGVDAPVAVPQAAVGYLNPRPYLFRPCTGRALRDREIPLVFNVFTRAVRAITSRKFVISSPHANVGESLSRILIWMTSKQYEHADFAFYIDRFQRAYSYNAFVQPEPPLDPVLRHNLEKIHVKLNGFPSMFFYGTYDAKTPIQPPVELMHAAWAVHEQFDEFVGHFHLAAQMLTHPQWKRKDFVEFAFAASREPGPLMMRLKSKMLDDHELKSVDFPLPGEVSVFFRARYRHAHQYILENLPTFGVAPGFFYNADPEFGSRYVVGRYLAPNREVLEVLSYDDVQDLISTEMFGPLLRRARNEGKMIKFDFPVNFDIKEIETWDAGSSPIVLPSSSNIFSVKPVTFQFTFNDVVIDDTIASESEYGYAPYQLDYYPFIDRDESLLPDLFQHLRSPKFEYSLHQGAKFIANY
jgi:hypothetical protein